MLLVLFVALAHVVFGAWCGFRAYRKPHAVLRQVHVPQPDGTAAGAPVDPEALPREYHSVLPGQRQVRGGKRGGVDGGRGRKSVRGRKTTLIAIANTKCDLMFLLTFRETKVNGSFVP